MGVDGEPFREGVRRQLRDSVLDAARDLAVARGWGKVRMEDVATTAGVSRRTVYNEFANRDRLGEAVVRREIGVFMSGIRQVLAERDDDLRGAVEGAVRFALEAAAANPLVRSALTAKPGDADSLLPYLTTDAQMILTGAMELIEEYVRRNLPDVPPGRIELGAEILARVVLSNIVLPRAPVDQVARELAGITVRYVAEVAGSD